MKDVAPQDRPREKLERLGAHGLGDNELVALVLGSGSREAGALALANRLIASAGGLHGLPRVGVDGLRHLEGVGPAKAAQIVAAVVLFHNHPSGDPTPSPDDLALTARMVSAGDIMGIDVVDHVILADQRYFSLVESGRLPLPG